MILCTGDLFRGPIETTGTGPEENTKVKGAGAEEEAAAALLPARGRSPNRGKTAETGGGHNRSLSKMSWPKSQLHAQ